MVCVVEIEAGKFLKVHLNNNLEDFSEMCGLLLSKSNFNVVCVVKLEARIILKVHFNKK